MGVCAVRASRSATEHSTSESAPPTESESSPASRAWLGLGIGLGLGLGLAHQERELARVEGLEVVVAVAVLRRYCNGAPREYGGY